MNLSMKWLNDYVKIDYVKIETSDKTKIKEFTDKMTMSGSKVEKYTDLSADIMNVVVGRVETIERHADSDKLWVAQIDIGDCKPVQIVTGAQNVYEGACIPVVLDGGSVIDRHNKSVTKIKKGKLRGVVSEGMMCSFDELGMEHSDFPYASKDGILIFNDDPDFAQIKIGMDVIDFVGLKDITVEFEITNNRPDCLAVLGLAREAAAVYNLPFEIKKPNFKGIDGELDLTVDVRNTKLCSRYMAAVVRNVKIQPSPRWIVERLRASGVRAINNFVDITNYVMLEYGHPMHAFDKKYVSGNSIIVRNANDGEKITLLDGSEQVLNHDILVIADDCKPIAVAGVMGGEYSGIMADTDTVVFEAACFDGVSVRRSAKKIGRRTESSSRFEKGLDPINAHDALYRALELVELLNCGEVISKVIDVDSSCKETLLIKHNPDKINAILGTEISASEQLDILKRLGFSVVNKDDDCFLTPPHVRIDIENDCDIAEEIARIYGYDRINPTTPAIQGKSNVISREEAFENKLVSIMLGQGSYECLSYSFISPKAYEKAGLELTDSIKIRNPLGEDTSVMRTSMLPSMLDILSRNYNNRINAVRFFEIARTYLSNNSNDTEVLPFENKVLAIGMYGAHEDFFTLKGITEELFEKIGVSLEKIKYTALRSNKSYHSGRCAEITIDGAVIGVLGEVSPVVLERYDINAGNRAYAAEINVDKLFELVSNAFVPKYKSLPKYPAMTRDLSFVCDENTSSGEIMEVIRKNAKLLEHVSFFDIYRGGQIAEGKKSLSYKLVLRKADGTLTDEEADRIVGKVVGALVEKGIELRKA